MLDKNAISIVLFTSVRAAENKVSISAGDPQNCMDPFPVSRLMSTAALQTIQPAHLPLISLLTFTAVGWVVIDIGSIQPSSVE